MNSRAQILSRIKQNQPGYRPLPDDAQLHSPAGQQEVQAVNKVAIEQFKTVLIAIGGAVADVYSYEEISAFIATHFKDQKRIISTLSQLSGSVEKNWQQDDPHSFENVDLAIIEAHFGVGENAALWVTESLMQQRVVPFICQQLAVVVRARHIYPTMHEAYKEIGAADYGFGAFIAGPSKTADIEQSLVLGAHGPKNMTVFLLHD